MASAKRTAEYRKIQDNYAKISSTLTELVSPGDLASKLFEARLVGKQLKQFANKEIRDDGERINRLLGAVHNQIELNSANFYKFIKILEEYVELEELLKLLKLETTQQQQETFDSSPAGEMRLSVRDLSVLTRTLKGAAARWKTIGLALGFLDDELTIIQRKPLLIPEGDTGYFRDMLSRWLKWAPPNHRWPTLEVLAAALNEAGEEGLAYHLKQQYLSQNGSADRVVPVSPPTTHPSSARTDVPASQPRSRAGLRSTIETSSDLETREKSKLDPGNADKVVPVSPPTTSARKYVPPYQPHSRAGLRSTIETSSDLESREKTKVNAVASKSLHCPSWRWCGGVCFVLGVAAVVAAAAVQLYPDMFNNTTSSIEPTSVLHNSKTLPEDLKPATKGIEPTSLLHKSKTPPADLKPTPKVDCHRISTKQELGKAVATIGNWETLCENLGAPEAVPKQLRFANMENEVKRSRCLEAYLNTGKACWEKVVQVVGDYPFDNRKLAKEIADDYSVDYSSIFKD